MELPWKGADAFEVRHVDQTPGTRGPDKYDVLSYVATLTLSRLAGLEGPPVPKLVNPVRN